MPKVARSWAHKARMAGTGGKLPFRLDGRAMDDKRKSSPYKRGKRHMVAAIIIGVSIVWGLPILTMAFGIWSDNLMTWLAVPLFAWLVYFGVGSLLIRCPRCGRSVFMRGYFVSVAWPAKTCGNCGQDLTIE